MAHLGMGVLFVTWLSFQVALGREDAPAVLDLLLGSIGGVWFGMVVREQGRRDETVEAKADRAEAKADRLEAELRGDDNDTDAAARGGRDGG